MGARRTVMIIITILLTGALFASVVGAGEPQRVALDTVPNLQNVRDYAPAPRQDAASFAVDGGALYVGNPGAWQLLNTPKGVIVNTVAVDGQRSNTVYIGAANEMAVYVSSDAGKTWMRVPLDTKAIGAVTDIAVDSANRLVYVGTDTDGVHRLRDVGTSMIAAGHLLLDEPVIELVADSTGAGLALVRTQSHLYRAEEFGLSWVEVKVPSTATAVAIANTNPATLYVGTESSGVFMSHDGVAWESVNTGLGMVPGSRLFVNALAVDPVQPSVLYVATSYLFGSTVVHNAPRGVHLSVDGADQWTELAPVTDAAIVALMPVPGNTGAVYALTETSRTPMALGNAPSLAPVTEVAASQGTSVDLSTIIAWLFAGLAGLMFLAAVGLDLARRYQKNQAKESFRQKSAHYKR